MPYSVDHCLFGNIPKTAISSINCSVMFVTLTYELTYVFSALVHIPLPPPGNTPKICRNYSALDMSAPCRHPADSLDGLRHPYKNKQAHGK